MADESQEIFREKVKFKLFFRKSEIFSEIGGKSETGVKCIMVSGGMDAPVYKYIYITLDTVVDLLVQRL